MTPSTYVDWLVPILAIERPGPKVPILLEHRLVKDQNGKVISFTANLLFWNNGDNISRVRQTVFSVLDLRRYNLFGNAVPGCHEMSRSDHRARADLCSETYLLDDIEGIFLAIPLLSAVFADEEISTRFKRSGVGDGSSAVVGEEV